MPPEPTTTAEDPRLLENVCLVRFAYHLWRVDTAARALPTDLSAPDIDVMKNRWEIGLVLEVEDLRRYIADACMMGFMTTSLSKSLSDTLNWARIDKYPAEICWDKLPKPDQPRVPLLPWMFGYSPNYFKTQLHWWDYPHKSSCKPAWWDHPEKLHWLYEVRIPRHLLGEQISALHDSMTLLRKSERVFIQLAGDDELSDAKNDRNSSDDAQEEQMDET